MQKFYLVWDDSRHALGIPSLDQQHRELMGLVNELSVAVEHGCDCEQAQRQMEKLLDFAADHFSHEEALMQEHGFPDLEQHAAEHKRILDEAANLMKSLRPDDSSRALLITAFLTDCAENHILHDDQAISQYFRAQGIKAM